MYFKELNKHVYQLLCKIFTFSSCKEDIISVVLSVHKKHPWFELYNWIEFEDLFIHDWQFAC